MGKLTFRRKRNVSSLPLAPPPPAIVLASTTTKTAVKKKPGSRPWMRIDRWGNSELIECDKSVIIRRASIPTRDLRILGPIFSQSSNILAREKAMIMNLEFIRAIVTAEEVLLLDPLRQEVLQFVDQLKRQLPQKSLSETGADLMVSPDNEMHSLTCGQMLPVSEAGEVLQDELPFEFQVLEVALEAVCMYLDSRVYELEREAYPTLDELTINVTTKNLEHVRSLKSNLNRLLGQVQKVRDEIEHLLDDDEDMADLCLTQKWIQNQQSEAFPTASASNRTLTRFSFTRSGSSVSSSLNNHDVEDLEMLLEAYFTKLEGSRNKILSVRDYVDDTEDYLNIQLDNHRNELIQLRLIMTIASFAITIENLLTGIFGMNIPCTLYDIDGIFGHVVVYMTTFSIFVFVLILRYAKRKKLIGS